MAVKRMTIWIDENLVETMDLLKIKEDMKNQSDFINRAVEFYSGYLLSRNSTKYISDILIGQMEGIVKSSENRIQRQLIHNTTELNMLLNLKAYETDLNEDIIENLRKTSLKEVVKTSGAISFEQAYAFQKGGE